MYLKFLWCNTNVYFYSFTSEIPSQPGKPRIGMLQIQARDVTINWDAPLSDNNSPLRNYTVQTQLGEGDFGQDVIVPHNETSFKIDG